MKSMRHREAEDKYKDLLKNGFKYEGPDKGLRKELFSDLDITVKILDKIKSENSGHESDDNRKKYLVDVAAGLILYRILPPERIGLRAAADDGTWKYLSLEVLPDITYRRWADSLNPGRFYAESKRIWLKTLWWYIHLSWQGDANSTRKILESRGLSTDAIVQLVERSGNGYRIDLYREIIKQFAKYQIQSDKKLMRPVMKLNTAMLLSIEPAYAEGGISGYVKRLFESSELGLGICRTSPEETDISNVRKEDLTTIDGFSVTETETNSTSKIGTYEEDKILADLGDANAQFRIGEQFFAEELYIDAAKMYNAAAKQRHGEAYYKLGMMYEKGLGMLQNTAQAKKLYNLALKFGYQVP